MGSGPGTRSRAGLAAAGVHVLAVAGRNARLAARLESLAGGEARAVSRGLMLLDAMPAMAGKTCSMNWSSAEPGRVLLVGYESGNQQILINIKKGVRVNRARQFTKDCRDLGITIHGTFIVGLPGETTETIQETIRFAKEINPHFLQVSIAAPYPGTALYRQARENGWLPEDDAALIDEGGVQAAALSYPNLNRTEIYDSVESFYRQFYFRAGKIAEMSAEMLSFRVAASLVAVLARVLHGILPGGLGFGQAMRGGHRFGGHVLTQGRGIGVGLGPIVLACLLVVRAGLPVPEDRVYPPADDDHEDDCSENPVEYDGAAHA